MRPVTALPRLPEKLGRVDEEDGPGPAFALSRGQLRGGGKKSRDYREPRLKTPHALPAGMDRFGRRRSHWYNFIDAREGCQWFHVRRQPARGPHVLDGP